MINKAEIVKEFGKDEKDTGSVEVQIALLSAKIENLTNQVRKKLQKGKSLSVIAEECEEEESVIQEIIESINAEES